jgi:hypothetical protein
MTKSEERYLDFLIGEHERLKGALRELQYMLSQDPKDVQALMLIDGVLKED